MKKFLFARKAGCAFTLVETVVAVALFALLVAALFQVIASFYPLYNAEGAAIDAGYSAAAVAAALVDTARQADAVVGSHAFSGTTYESGEHSVVLELPSVNTSGQVIPGSFDYVAIVASGTAVYEFVDTAELSRRPNGSHTPSRSLSSLEFTYDAAGPTTTAAVGVAVSTFSTAGGRSAGASVSRRAYLRNR